jgi:hypothetical protein
MPLTPSTVNEKTGDLLAKGILQAEKINNDFNNPYSEALKAANSNATLAQWNIQQKEDFLHDFFRRLHFIKMLLSALTGQKYGKGAYDAEDEEIAEELERSEQLAKLIDQLEKKRALDAAANDLNVLKLLLEEREELVLPLVQEWQALQAGQINNLSKEIASSDFKINNKDFILTDKDKTLLSKVAKAQEIQLKHPYLIPAGSFSSAQYKADTAILINLARCAAAQKYSGEYVLVAGNPPPIDTPTVNSRKALYVHLINNTLHYSIKDEMGEYQSTKIDPSQMHNVYFAAIINSLKNPSHPLGDEAKRALFEITAKKGYRQKLEAEDIQGVGVSDAAELNNSLRPKLSPFFKKTHKEEELLKEKQAAAYEKINKKNEQIKAHLQKDSLQSLKEDVFRAYTLNSATEEPMKSSVPRPFSTKFRPPGTASAQG